MSSDILSASGALGGVITGQIVPLILDYHLWAGPWAHFFDFQLLLFNLKVPWTCLAISPKPWINPCIPSIKLVKSPCLLSPSVCGVVIFCAYQFSTLLIPIVAGFQTAHYSFPATLVVAAPHDKDFNVEDPISRFFQAFPPKNIVNFDCLHLQPQSLSGFAV